MCQIIASSNFNLSKELVSDIFRGNRDGLGFMIRTDNGVEVNKCLPQNAKAAWAAYMKHAHGRKGALHFRMRTDGDISLERVHPYEVVPGKLWMMHNGVLSEYRSRDKESDTQKYISAVLRPLLRCSFRLWRERVFLEMIEKDIRSGNRFVLMDYTGTTRIVNGDTGFYLGEDWYANSYSFSASHFYPDRFEPRVFPAKPVYVGGGYVAQQSMLPYMTTHAIRPVEPLGSVYPPKDLPPPKIPTTFERLTAEEAAGHLCKDPQQAVLLAKRLRSLRAVDAQEFYALLGEVTTAVNRSSPKEYPAQMETLRLGVMETLEDYSIVE